MTTLKRETTQLTLGPRLGIHPDRLQHPRDPRPVTIPECGTLTGALRHWADRDPGRTLFHFIGSDDRLTALTAGELHDNARMIAAGLARRGIAKGDRVLIGLETSADLIEAFFGCSLAGAVPTLVDLPSSKQGFKGWLGKLESRLRLIEPAALILEPSLAGAVRDWAGSGANPQAPRSIGSPDEFRDQAAGFDAPALEEQDTAFLQFTSGTTQDARAVRINHRSLLANCRALAQGSLWDSGDLMLGWLPLFHDMGLVATTLSSFVHGIPVVLMPPQAFLLRPAKWLWAIHHFRATSSFAPNFAYQICATRVPGEWTVGLDLSSWRRAYNAAEFVHAETIRAFTERFQPFGFDPGAIVPAYGMAEITVAASGRDLRRPIRIDSVSRADFASKGVAAPVDAGSPDAIRFVSVGPAFPGNEAKIVTPSGDEAGERVQGEILLRGESVFQGYFRNPEASESSLRDGWLRTGDLGYRVGDELFICGRAKDLIIRAGENHHPQNMEFAASQVEGVRPGCVVAAGVRNPSKGTEDVVVVFEVKPEVELSRVPALRKQVEEAVLGATGLRPDRVVPVPGGTVSKTTSGKIQRSLMESYLAREIR